MNYITYRLFYGNLLSTTQNKYCSTIKLILSLNGSTIMSSFYVPCSFFTW